MIYKIELLTTKQGLDLYQSLSKKIEEYYNRLEKANQKIKKIKNYLKLFPSLENNETIKDIYFQLEFHGLFLISYLDLSLIGREIIVSKRTWEKLFYAKQAYLVVYETLNTYNKHKEEVNKLLNLISSEKLNNDYKLISQKIKELKRQYDISTEMNDIRNKIAGHIEKKFDEYFSTLEIINIEKTAGLIRDFVIIVVMLQRFSYDLLNEYTNVIDHSNAKTNDDVNALIDKINDILMKNNNR